MSDCPECGGEISHLIDCTRRSKSQLKRIATMTSPDHSAAIRLAKEAGIELDDDPPFDGPTIWYITQDDLTRFYALVRAEVLAELVTNNGGVVLTRDSLSSVRALDDTVSRNAGSSPAVLPHQTAHPAKGDGWLPIESAPKDGTHVFVSLGIHVTIGRWAEHFSAHHFSDTSAGWYCDELNRRIEPTHWMPLPPAPKEAP